VRTRPLLAAALVLLALAAPARAEDVRPPGLSTPLGNELLSNETTITRWAFANAHAKVREGPSAFAPSIARLRYRTEDGQPEVYLVLRSYVDSKSRTWLLVRIPARPNGQTGWVTDQQLGPLHLVRTKLRINRRTLRATLFRSGIAIWSSPIGVGKRSTPTPAGHFYVRERLRNLRGNPLYGPWAFGTSAYSILSDWPGGGVVGIHGTDQPNLIPGRPSHGCIRVPNRNISRLAHLLPIGTPVQIL